MPEYRYLTNCVDSTAQLHGGDVGAAGEAINEMVNEARDITWATFRKHVGVDEVRRVFPQYSYQREHHNPSTGELTAPMHIKDDYAVGFHRGVYMGHRAYYIQHSRIEYIFVTQEASDALRDRRPVRRQGPLLLAPPHQAGDRREAGPVP